MLLESEPQPALLCGAYPKIMVAQANGNGFAFCVGSIRIALPKTKEHRDCGALSFLVTPTGIRTRTRGFMRQYVVVGDIRALYGNARRCRVRFCLMHNEEKEKHRGCGVSLFLGDPYGNRTHIFAVRGRRLSRLTKGPDHATSVLYHTFFEIAIVF